MHRNIVIAIVIMLSVLITGIASWMLLMREENEYLVAVTFPGLIEELERLVGEDKVILVVAPGSDPHEASLTPEGRMALSRAIVIITMGHTHVDLEIEELKEKGLLRGEVVNIAELEGIRKPVLPDGRFNYHEIYCNPFNLKIILKHIAGVLAKSNLTDENIDYRLEKLLKDVEDIISKSGLMGGREAIITYAGIQPQIEWLGLKVVYYLAEEMESSPPPETLHTASKLIAEKDVIVVVRVDARSEPLTSLDSWLLREALKYNRPVMKVKSCSLSTSTIYVLRDTVAVAESTLRGG